MEICRSNGMFQVAVGGLDAPAEAVNRFDLFCLELTVWEICDDVFVDPFCDLKTDDPKPHRIFGLLGCDEIKGNRLADAAVHGLQFRMDPFLFDV